MAEAEYLAVKKRYYGPWQTLSSGSSYRPLLGQKDDHRTAYIFKGSSEEWLITWAITVSSAEAHFVIKESAMAAVDAYLIKLGCVLLTQGQWEKLSVLI